MLLLRCLISSVFIFWSGTFFGQNEHLDSLLTVYETYEQTDSAQIALINEIAYTYYKIDIKKTEQFANLALKKSIDIGHKFGQSRALRNKAICYELMGDYQKAFKHLQEASAIAEEIKDDHLRCKLSNAMGIVLNSIHMYEEAINSYKQALRICGNVNDTLSLGYINANLGSLHFNNKNHEKAREYFSEVLRLGKEKENVDLISIGFQELGQLYLQDNQLDEAYDALNQALKTKLIDDNEYDSHLGGIHSDLAKIMLRKNDIQEAEIHLNASKNYLKSTGSLYRVLVNISIEYEILDRRGKSNDAIAVIDDGIVIAKEIKDLKSEALFNKLKADIYKKKGNYKEALKLNEEGELLSDSLASLTKDQRILDLENKYEFEKKKLS